MCVFFKFSLPTPKCWHSSDISTFSENSLSFISFLASHPRFQIEFRDLLISTTQSQLLPVWAHTKIKRIDRNDMNVILCKKKCRNHLFSYTIRIKKNKSLLNKNFSKMLVWIRLRANSRAMKNNILCMHFNEQQKATLNFTLKRESATKYMFKGRMKHWYLLTLSNIWKKKRNKVNYAVISKAKRKIFYTKTQSEVRLH